MAEFAALRDAATAAADKPLAEAANEVLRRSAGARRAPRTAEAPSFRARHSDATLALLRGARWPPELGLVRAIDLRGRRHIHGAGWRPAGSVTAELGALLPRGSGAELPLWIMADGRIATSDVTPAGAQGGSRERMRHVAAPLFARRGARRLRRFARRALDLAVVRPLGPASPDPAAEPDGYLHAEAVDASVPLWVGEHPTTGDQYSANSAEEVLNAGYANPRLVGHLEAHAPVTGRLGVHATPIIPWA
jgi:hypothetical protein